MQFVSTGKRPKRVRLVVGNVRVAVVVWCVAMALGALAGCGKGRSEPPRQAPVAEAGPDQTITVGQEAVLHGSGTPATAALAWSMESGPGTVTFSAPTAADTAASFSAAGTYVLKLTATEGEASGSDTVTVTVAPPDTTLAVQASASPSTVTLPDGVSLQGTVSEAGATVQWTKVSGPGDVTFTAASALATTATFSAEGTYGLKLSATKGDKSGNAVVTVTVNPQPVPPPTVTITAPSASASLSGRTTVTATLSSTTGVTKVLFSVNGQEFAQVDPAATVNAELNTLTVANGSATIKVATTGNAAEQTVSVSIGNGRTLYVKDAEGGSGSTVTLHVLLNDVADVAGYVTTLQWDPARLQLDASSVKAGAAVPAGALFSKNANTPGQLKATVAGTDAFTNAAGGEVLTASFTVLAPAGTRSDITMSEAKLASVTGSTIAVTAGSGVVVAK